MTKGGGEQNESINEDSYGEYFGGTAFFLPCDPTELNMGR
jgi:hypothetical protein